MRGFSAARKMHWTTVGELPTGFQFESSFIILRANKTAKPTKTSAALPSLSRTTLNSNAYDQNENSLYNRLFNRNNNNEESAAADKSFQKNNLRMLYECTHNNWLSNFVSTQSNCDGKGRMIRPAGYVYTSDQVDVLVNSNEYALGLGSHAQRLTLRALFKCFISENGDFFVSADQQCEQSFVRKTQLLGYFLLDYKP
jgi:hypothetical protein